MEFRGIGGSEEFDFRGIQRICVPTVDTLRFGMATDQAPKRIISARVLARRLEISPNSLSKHIRRELVVADYESDCGSFFDPARLPQLKQTIAENRQRNWRHTTISGVGVAVSPAIG